VHGLRGGAGAADRGMVVSPAHTRTTCAIAGALRAVLHLSRRDLTLLVLLTLAWGLNWPMMKIGVVAFPPLLFRVLGLAGGVLVLCAYMHLRRESVAIAREHWPTVLLLALPNVIIWQIVSVLALRLLPSGRAAILGYTMPIWSVLIGLWVFGERPLRRYWWGIAAAFAGTLLLLSSEFAKLAGSPLGTLLMLFAAASWAWGTHLMRRHLTNVPTIALTIWMLSAAVPVAGLASIAFETAQWRMPNGPEWVAILYNIFVALSFCHIVWFKLARQLPPAASGLSVMMIPVVGVFSAMWILGEAPGWQDYAALLLILFALGTVLLVPKPPAPNAAQASGESDRA
jgi:drug/metabolite transporter (DMT)-like permease